ncbi:tail terminator [Gordonia phage Yvonnetastic]|uniref:Tail terminator n=1 Tax=Gordonia phage Yvonnetastic TaxID=1821566 RepID=A0A142K8Z8_9CAUD|nr:tail terminator [Gordonia phage Yvonnetastic]AMS02581.1 tail terminator [Gordonia phage Yvonnetastic]WKW86013.1 tail terminator [Gordonia Phage JonJames]
MDVEDIDPELMLMALLDDLGYTDTVIPEYKDFLEAEAEGSDKYWAGWDDILPIIVVNRLPAGGVTPDELQDRALMAVVVVGESRKHAHEVAKKVRKRILNGGHPFEITYTDEDGNQLGPFLIEPTSEVEPASLEPDIDPDNRFVEANYWMPISLRF